MEETSTVDWVPEELKSKLTEEMKKNSTSDFIYIDKDRELESIANKNGLLVLGIGVWVEGVRCGKHGGPIIGWDQDEYTGKSYHDDGYCSKRYGCYSHETECRESRRFVFSPKITSDSKQLTDHKKRDLLRPLLITSIPNPVDFSWKKSY